MPTVNRVLSDETGAERTIAEPHARPESTRTEPSGTETTRSESAGTETDRTDPVPAEPVGNEPTVSVIVPALNEARNLPHVFARLPQVDEIVLVDGGSTDDTVAVARRLRPDIRVVRQNRRGKGNALACGFAAATGDIIVMIDADGSTDPLEIPSFVQTLLSGADFAKGSRFSATGGSADITRLRRAGNRCLSLLVNVLFGTRYSDLCYGYNAFWARHLEVFDLDHTSPAPDTADGRLWGDGFEIETLLNLRAARARLDIVEVPSFEHSRIHGVSNLNALTDGMRVLRTIAREWRPRRTARGAAVKPGPVEQKKAPVG
ncbi:putative glycosyltransferase [Actinoplanes missouriensis 431]|uniref:Putative glycosyltransferase n=1 Tax=Actinoplanes missouriensis (strain ATCC 14538 / DSM 43046 / CBS 188.64 / JCM 3121 / NBRC 102363 / NCIMB 12654 / NRRL B-3342 / UNCC 431) TaxID=512565 RepID=I0HFS9_ACTM4|nr:glycosyltransferase family 2 protein [Actinoplanes missouriensis]BAL91866.1 putative glycosyltransferase [Actinoplanes missouriensis 431]